ncbi:L,D-transpeptidase [Frigidibacter sp. MR17.14]|uniref:L,D-transpeptidase n=1 Tax=Frigidibacter sp. MR17.14 TaxID=3126509 RepID=UPI003012D8B1
MLARRAFLAALPAAGLAACAPRLPETATRSAPPPPPDWPPLPARYGAITDEPYPVPAIPEGVVNPYLWRQEVENPYPDEVPGTIIVDPEAALLHLIEPEGRALRYGVSVGAAGFAWQGRAVLQYGQKWPRWKVPDEMAARWPKYEPYTVANGGMDPGPGNPLGARALYLWKDGKDTLYRIHGGCAPEHLGKAVSSGCIRMLDQDVIDLYGRVGHRVAVSVLPAKLPTLLPILY